MRNFYIAITFLCAALLALLVMIACALEPDRPEEPQAIAPEVNAEGLCSVTAVRAPEYEMYFTEADVIALAQIFAAQHISVNLIKHNLTTLKRLPHLTMLGLRKKENEYTYAPCTKQQAEELIRGLREIVPYVVIDCSSYIANDILSAVALMEADSVLQLASCDLKSVGYLSSQLPLLGELKWDKDKQYRVASNIKPFQAADRIGQVLGSVVFRLPYSQELEEQYLAGELLADLSMKDSRAFRKEIDRICEEVF